MRKKIIIMGAAGRDFHNFNTRYRRDPTSEVVAFTATQIPSIDTRTYPPKLCGELYPGGIPIYPEAELEKLITELKVDQVVFAYSDVTYAYVMARSARVLALGADFLILGPRSTMLASKKPVISVTAVRTGCGKSSVSKLAVLIARKLGKKVVAIRHPMPYGDLARQEVQRFKSYEDLLEHDCTIEEREEYEPYIEEGVTVYAGVDYAEILRGAESEADIILWDGGNNDFSFIEADLSIVVADPLRAGDETAYHPGEVNLRMADVVVINKVDSASAADIEKVSHAAKDANPEARIIKTRSVVSAGEGAATLRGKHVLVIEDGPTLTHGSMTYGAGIKAARDLGAISVDPAPFAKGSLKSTLEKYPRLQNLLPAMGYSEEQRKELAETIDATPCDAVLIATPIDLKKIIEMKKPAYRVRYEIEDIEEPGLSGALEEFMKKASSALP